MSNNDRATAIRRILLDDDGKDRTLLFARVMNEVDVLVRERDEEAARADSCRRDVRREVYNEVVADLLASGLRLKGAYATIARHWVEDLRDELTRLNGGPTSVHNVDLLAEAVTERNEAIRELSKMSGRLDDADAQAKRLRRYGEGWEDDFREQMQGQHGEFVEKTIQQMRDEYLQPGDMPDMVERRGQEIMRAADDLVAVCDRAVIARDGHLAKIQEDS